MEEADIFQVCEIYREQIFKLRPFHRACLNIKATVRKTSAKHLRVFAERVRPVINCYLNVTLGAVAKPPPDLTYQLSTICFPATTNLIPA